MKWRSFERPIEAPKQLLVEGRTPEIFFREWVERPGLKGQVEGIRLMEHIWNRVPSHCLIAWQPDPGKMKPAVRTLCGLVD